MTRVINNPGAEGHRWHSKVVALAVSMLVLVIYRQGIESGFILDDTPNLYLLEEINNGSMSVWRFITEGQSGPGGRPISLLSFALQHDSWPDRPLHFKVVNVLIHMLNGILIFAISHLIGHQLKLTGRENLIVAGIATCWWAVHPLHISSVLYVVQRMNLLSHFFILSSMLAYLCFRRVVIRGDHYVAVFILAGIVFLGLVFAVLCKENGILLPFYLLVIELTLYREKQTSAFVNVLIKAILIIPIVMFIGYLVWQHQMIMDGFDRRDFNLSERLLTESRILWMYVHSIFFPNPNQYGLAHDAISVSRSLISPPTTLLSIGAWLLVLLTVFRLKKRIVVFGFGVCFFLAGHVLESTVIPLELYFEHRNYLASYGLLYMVTFLLRAHYASLSNWVNYLKRAMLYCLVGIFTLVSIDVSRLWASPMTQAISWYMHKPNSLRANQYLFSALMNNDDLIHGEKQLESLLVNWPHVGMHYVKKLHLVCDDSVAQNSLNKELGRSIAEAEFNIWDLIELEKLLLKKKVAGQCEGITHNFVLGLFEALSKNKKMKDIEYKLYDVMGRYYYQTGDYRQSLKAWQRSLEKRQNPMAAYFTALSFYELGQINLALEYLKIAENGVDPYSDDYFFKMKKINHLRGKLWALEKSGPQESVSK